MLDVGQQQLLVLLFVVQAKGDQRAQRATFVGARSRSRQQCLHALVDVRPVALDGGHAGPAEQPALRPRMLLTDALVIAVEQHAEVRIEGLERVLMALEDKGLEEPGQMRQMPFGRAGVGHRLHLAILVGKRLGQTRRGATYRGVLLRQRTQRAFGRGCG